MSKRTEDSVGIKGISWHIRIEKYFVRVPYNGYPHSVGYYETLEEALAAKKGAEMLLSSFIEREVVE